VNLGREAVVHGDVRTGGRVLRAERARIEGSVTENANIPNTTLRRRATFDVSSPRTDVRVRRGTTLAEPMVPGAYGDLHLEDGSRATLRTGNYLFEDVDLGRVATLVIDDREGPVFVYVEKGLEHRGTVESTSGDFPGLVVLGTGHGTMKIRSPFRGSIVAPDGKIEFLGDDDKDCDVADAVHEGTFFAESIRIGRGVTTVRRDLPWLITGISFDKTAVCAGETVRLSVDAEEPSSPGTPARVTIDGMPVPEVVDQVEGTKKRIYAVSAAASDGTRESRRAAVEILTCAPDRAPLPRLFGQSNVYHPDTLDFAVVNAVAFEGGDVPMYEWDFGDGSPPLVTASRPCPTTTERRSLSSSASVSTRFA